MQMTLGKRLIQAAEEARSIVRGETAPSTYRVHVPAEVDVKATGQERGMTQAEFSVRYGFPLGILRDWEQGKGKPDTSARVLLLVIAKDSVGASVVLYGSSGARTEAYLAAGPLDTSPCESMLLLRTPLALNQEQTLR
jgi:putative transcriptional regulator